MKVLVVGLAMTFSVAACGADSDDGGRGTESTSQVAANNDVAAVQAGTLPDPCELLSEEQARTLLGADAVRNIQRSTAPAVERGCVYEASTAAGTKSVALILQMTSGMAGAMPRPPEESLTSLIGMLMTDREPVETIKEGDRYTFVFDKADTSKIRVLTNIRGTASFSGISNAELHVSLFLKDGSQTTEQRIAAAKATIALVVKDISG